jgi:hypothetical protein
MTTVHDLAAKGAERVEHERANKTAQLRKEAEERQRLEELQHRRRADWNALRAFLLAVWPSELAMRLDRDPPEGFEPGQIDVEITVSNLAGGSVDRSMFYSYLTRGEAGSWGARLYRAADRFGNTFQTREIAVAAAWVLSLVHPPIDEPLAVMPYYGPKRPQPAPVPLSPLEKPVTLAHLAAQGVQRVEAERQRLAKEVTDKGEEDQDRAKATELSRKEAWEALHDFLSTIWPPDLLARLDFASHPDFSGGLNPTDPLIEVRVRGFFGGNLNTWGADGDHSALFAQLTRDPTGGFKLEGYRCWDRAGTALETTDLSVALAFVLGKTKGPLPEALKG